MKIKTVSLLVLMLISFTSCSRTGYLQGNYSNTCWINVYYASAEIAGDEEFIKAEKCEIPETNLEQMVHAIYLQCCSKPISNSMKSAIPQNTTLNSVKISDGTVILDLSKEYENNIGFSRTVADYCLTMSLCELEGVRAVTILVNGAPPAGKASKNLMPDDIILANLNLEGYSKSFRLYFPNDDYTDLELEVRDIVSSGEDEAILVFKALAEGPSQKGLKEAFPYDVKINSVKISNGLCTVDFSSEFINNKLPSEKAEQMCIRAIASSLSEIQGIEKVQILVDGATTEGFTYVDLSVPFAVGEA